MILWSFYGIVQVQIPCMSKDVKFTDHTEQKAHDQNKLDILCSAHITQSVKMCPLHKTVTQVVMQRNNVNKKE